jgi:hypothetical protein
MQRRQFDKGVISSKLRQIPNINVLCKIQFAGSPRSPIEFEYHKHLIRRSGFQAFAFVCGILFEISEIFVLQSLRVGLRPSFVVHWLCSGVALLISFCAIFRKTGVRTQMDPLCCRIACCQFGLFVDTMAMQPPIENDMEQAYCWEAEIAIAPLQLSLKVVE